MELPPPRTAAEKELESLQIAVTQGDLANVQRRQLIVEFYEQGMSQGEIAARLSRAAIGAGGQGVGIDAVEHIVRRWRGRKGNDHH